MRLTPMVVLAFVVSCGGNPPPKTAQAPANVPLKVVKVTKTTTHPTPVSPSIRVTSDIIEACGIKIDDPQNAPRFDFDEHALLPQDFRVLDQVADCMRTGALANKSLGLIGRADPRGTVDYNFALGSQRANEVAEYLAQRGVSANRLRQTSRGELDAEGTDESGWRNDRRVDLVP